MMFQRSTKGVLIVLAVFLVILFTSFIFSPFERVPWYRQAVMTIVTPPQELVVSMRDAVSRVWHRYIYLVNAATENESLRRRVEELGRRLDDMATIEGENARLRELLAMSAQLKLTGIGAGVVASDPRAEFKTVTIDKGYNDGVRKNMVVIGHSGLVGRVGQTGTSEASVFLISDPNSAVDVMVQRTGARALLVGASRKVGLRPFYSLSRLEYLRRVSDIQEGDIVITSGLDRLFPSGIPIGTVHNIKIDEAGVFKDADVVPFVDFSKMREVLVLLIFGDTHLIRN